MTTVKENIANVIEDNCISCNFLTNNINQVVKSFNVNAGMITTYYTSGSNNDVTFIFKINIKCFNVCSILSADVIVKKSIAQQNYNLISNNLPLFGNNGSINVPIFNDLDVSYLYDDTYLYLFILNVDNEVIIKDLTVGNNIKGETLVDFRFNYLSYC